MLSRLRQIGPGAIVAAAFIGPGTVTTATMAGAGFGYTLLWAVAFSVVATLILQEMSARLGVIGGMGVGTAIRNKLSNRWSRLLASFLVISAILVGNAAYEAGNLSGAALGFSYYLNPPTGQRINPIVIILGLIVIGLLFSGRYKLIERTLVALVALLAIVFLSSALYLSPGIGDIAAGMFKPSASGSGMITVLGLIGTTVVPYNIFLHASSVRQKWHSPSDLSTARWDTVVSVLLGGLVTMAVLITAAAAFDGQEMAIASGTDLGLQLVPMLGDMAYVVILVGFFAAGISSSLTAPLAAAFAASELFNWKEKGMRNRNFRLVWISVVLTGIVFSSLGIRPTTLILFAQVANGLLLPLIAAFLLWVMNDRHIMGRHANSLWINIAGILVILITLALGIKGIFTAMQML